MAGFVVSRTDWGATSTEGKEFLKSPAKKVVIHHTAMEYHQDREETYLQLQSIQREHIQTRKFIDIGYNFLIGQDGVVYEGRGWGVVGAHTKNHNDDSVGIAFMGNFNNDSPSSEALVLVKQLLNYGVSQGFLLPDFAIVGHRDLGNTECPGAKLYAALPQLRSA